MVGRRVTRWGRWRTALLVVLLLLPGTPEVLSRLYAEQAARARTMAALAPGRNVLPAQRERHQAAPPSPSGAYPPYPLNHSFDAEVVTLSGSPTNHTFEAAAYDVGTPPTNYDLEADAVDTGPWPNYDFATGDFTSWTTGGTPTIKTTGGPDGAWVEMGSGDSVITSSFTVASDAQMLTFDVGWLSTSGTDRIRVYVATAPNYTFPANSQPTFSISCTACNRWDTVRVEFANRQGQTIKIKFRQEDGTVGFDRGRPQVVFPNMIISGDDYTRKLDGTNDYAWFNDGGLTTDSFSINSAAQIGTVRVRGETTSSDQYNAYVLSGPTFATSTLVASGGVGDTWSTKRFNLSPWAGGDPIKIKVTVAYGAIGIDDLGLQRVEVPGWTIAEMATRVDDGQGGTAINFDGNLTSTAFTIPLDVQQLSLRYRTSDTSGTGVYAELLRGPTFTTVTNLAGGPLGGSSGVWRTYKANVTPYAGETVKIRVRPQLQSVFVDDAAVLEQAAPGWTLSATLGAIAPGVDANGTYVTGTTGDVLLVSSYIDPGIVDRSGYVDGRSYLVTYAIGQSSNSMLVIRWLGPTQNYTLVSVASNTPTGIVNRRFTISENLGSPGRLEVKLTNGGRIYSIADNVARQQLSEPFSQQAGAGIDTSTGSFGTSDVDLTIQGGPLPLSFTRYYHGHSDRFAELGYRWSHTFNTFLGIYGSDVAVVFGSGKEEFFDEDSGTFTPIDVRVKSTLTLLSPPVNGVDYRYVTKDKLVYNFEGDGDLISIVDPNGNAITVYRDATTERITSVTDPGGRAIAFAYDANGRLESITGPDGAEVTYTYDANGDLVAVDKPEDARTEYVYSRHRLTQIKQRQGEDLASSAMVTVLTNTLDDVNRVIAQTDAADSTIAIAYLTGDDQGITRVTDPLDEDTDYYFDEFARTTHVQMASGDVTQWVYDAVGNLEAIVDPATNEYQVAYNGAADPTAITDPLGNPTAITWDNAKHRPTQIVDARGYYTVNTYDSVGNLIQTVVDASKDALGNSIPGTHLDLMTVYTVDGDGRITGETVDPTKDAAGNVRSGSHLDLMTRYTYDAAGNKTSEIVDPSLDTLGNTRAGSHLDITWSRTYDDAGRVTSETRPNGHLTSYSYDPLGRLKRVRHVRGGVNEDLDLVWSLSGELLLVEDPLGHQWRWTYDERGLPETRTDPLDHTWTYDYDDAGRMERMTDPLGHVTAYAYDAIGRLTTTVLDPDDPNAVGDELNLTTSHAYDDAGHLASETVDPGSSPRLSLTTEYAYDEAGRLIGITLPNSGVYTFDYDDVGNLLSATDPELNVANYEYDGANRLTRVVDPLGHETTCVYDAAGRRIQTVVDPGSSPHLNLTTAYTFDAGGRMTAITTDPGSSPHLNLTTEYGYDAAGNLTSETNPEDETAWFEYDVYERLVEITDAESRVTEIGYDAAGRRTSLERLGGRLMSFTYDARDLLTAVVDELSNETSYGYDAAGRRISVTNPRGFTTAYAYDAANRLTEITDAAAPAGTVAFVYDASGRITDVTNPRGKITSYEYDALGNVTRETDPLDRERTATYDLLGRLDTATDARDVTLDYAYDAAGRLTTIAYPAFGSAPSGSVGYAYDAANRQTGMSDVTGATGWGYDAASRVKRVTSPQGTIDYDYDGAGRRTAMTLPGNKTVAYGYDAAGQLTSLLDWQNLDPTTYTYNANGQPTGVVRPNGIETAYEYDDAWRPVAVEHADGATLLARYDYALDENGNRTEVTTTGTAVATGTEEYEYDALDRLTEVTYPNGGGTIEYAYDKSGNRVERTSGSQVTTYAYDDADQLTASSGAEAVTYTYDENGNRVSADADTFAYDWRDRLVEAEVGSTTVDYTYAGDDLRATRDDGTTATDYLWDRIGALPMLVGEGTTNYLWDETGLLEEVDGGNPAGFPLADLLGSVRLRTDDLGAVVGTADYEVYGGVRAQSGTQGSLGWTGELRDADTGLTYLRSRDYAPGSGRFLQRDSVQPNAPGTQGYNRYAYGNGNPATFTDPTGQFAAGGSLRIERFVWEIPRGGWPSIGVFVSAIGRSIVTGIAEGGALRYGLAAVGRLPIMTAIAANPLLALGILALVITIVLVAYGINRWCDAHGLEFRECFGKGVAGLKHAISAGWSSVSLGIRLAKPLACEVALGALDPLAVKTDIAGNCPELPKPDESCALAAGAAALPDTVSAFASGNLEGAVSDIASAGISAVEEYEECKSGHPRDEEGHCWGLRDLPGRRQADVGATTVFSRPPNKGIGSIGKSNSQFLALAKDLVALWAAGADDIRVNQRQVDVHGVTVGRNRPDLQFTYRGQRFYVEYDSLDSDRGAGHRDRICANDPFGYYILRTV